MGAPQTVLVTGGAGFIGSHLVDHLAADGFQVIVLDDLSNGSTDNLPDQVSLEEGGINDVNKVQRLVDLVDGVFHLAAISSVQASLDDPKATQRVNLDGALNLLSAIMNTKKSYRQRLVFASSAAVYGDRNHIPINEGDPTLPLSQYGADKLETEKQIARAANSHAIPAAVLRPFNVYGPRQRPASPYSGVISIFADRISQGKKVTIFGTGEQVRDFIYVSDVAELFARAFGKADKSAPIINACTGKGTTIIELAEIIAEVTNQDLKTEFGRVREGDILRSIGSRSFADSILGSLDYHTLEGGLKNTINQSVTRQS